MNCKRIVCYGDSNTWGYNAADFTRFSDDLRWTRQLQKLLGERYMVMEEGVNGRTTVLDDPLGEGLNGLASLAPVLYAHQPIDLLVIMLGTNDCKERFAMTAANIGAGVRRLAMKAKELQVWRGTPNILLLAPAAMGEGMYDLPDVIADMGRDSVKKSQQLPARIRAVAAELDTHYLDINPFVSVDPRDCLHLTQDSQLPLAAALAEFIPPLVP